MGDSGSLLLGLLMAASTMVIGGRAPEVSGTTYFFFAPLFLPLFILGVPIADMAFAFVRRTARGQSFHTPDKDHLHHRLLRLGHGHRRSVIILWLWTALLSAFVLFPLFTKSGNTFIPLVAAGLGLLLYTLFHPRLSKSSEEDGASPVTVPQGRPEDDGASVSPLQGRPEEDDAPVQGISENDTIPGPPTGLGDDGTLSKPETLNNYGSNGNPDGKDWLVLPTDSGLRDHG